MLLDRFGLELNFEEMHSLLLLGKSIRLPSSVSSNADFIRYCEHLAEKNGERYELLCIMEKGAIISPIAHIQLMFIISKERYYNSLESLGNKFLQGKLGRYVKTFKT
jgi:hypothetical protein